MSQPNSVPGAWPWPQKAWTHKANDNLRKPTGNQPEPVQGPRISQQPLSPENPHRNHSDRHKSHPRVSESYPSDAGIAWPTVSMEQFNEVQEENRRLRNRIKQLEETNRLQQTGFQEILEQQINRLSEKETELGDLKKTLRMYDECSEADIQSKVDKLNASIQATEGTAMRWAKAAFNTSAITVDGEEVGEAERHSIQQVIGMLLFHALSDDKVATPCLMLAWQACIVTTVEKILSSFSASLSSSEEGRRSDGILRRISEEVMTGEVQPAYGRWRLVTHQYLRQTLSGGEEAAINVYAREALANCLTVGRLVLKDRCPNETALVEDFQEGIRMIMKEAIELSDMIRERMVTANYEPYVPSSGALFEPDFMAVEQRERIASDDRVICTTGIGLLYWWKEGGEGTSKTSSKLAFTKAQVFTVGNFYDLNSASRSSGRKGRK